LKQQRADSEHRWNALTRKLSSVLELSEATMQSEELIVSKVTLKICNTSILRDNAMSVLFLTFYDQACLEL
jgi:hypothetical protein